MYLLVDVDIFLTLGPCHIVSSLQCGSQLSEPCGQGWWQWRPIQGMGGAAESRLEKTRGRRGGVSGEADRRLIRDSREKGSTTFHAESKACSSLAGAHSSPPVTADLGSLALSCSYFTWRGTLTLNLQQDQRCVGREAGRALAGAPEPHSACCLNVITASYLHSSSFKNILVWLFCLFCTILTARVQCTLVPGDTMGPPSPMPSLIHPQGWKEPCSLGDLKGLVGVEPCLWSVDL